MWGQLVVRFRTMKNLLPFSQIWFWLITVLSALEARGSLCLGLLLWRWWFQLRTAALALYGFFVWLVVLHIPVFPTAALFFFCRVSVPVKKVREGSMELDNCFFCVKLRGCNPLKLCMAQKQFQLVLYQQRFQLWRLGVFVSRTGLASSL